MFPDAVFTEGAVNGVALDHTIVVSEHSLGVALEVFTTV